MQVIEPVKLHIYKLGELSEGQSAENLLQTAEKFGQKDSEFELKFKARAKSLK